MKNKLILYIAFGIIILTLIAAPVFLLPYYTDFQKLETTLKIKEEQIEEEKEQSLIMKNAYSKLLDYQVELEKIESAFPEKDLVIPEFHNFIKRETAYSGVALQGVGVGATFPVETSLNLEKTAFLISFIGSYSTLKNFLFTLYESARPVSVDSISISSAEEGGFFQINLSLGVYSYKEVKTVNTAEDEEKLYLDF